MTPDDDAMVFEQGRKGVTAFANGWQSIMNLFDPNPVRDVKRQPQLDQVEKGTYHGISVFLL